MTNSAPLQRPPHHSRLIEPLVRSSRSSNFTIAQDPRILWPDTLSIATSGYLYFTANQLHRQARFHEGKDLRKKPHTLFRVKIDAGPVLLK